MMLEDPIADNPGRGGKDLAPESPCHVLVIQPGIPANAHFDYLGTGWDCNHP